MGGKRRVSEFDTGVVSVALARREIGKRKRAEHDEDGEAKERTQAD